MVNRTLYRFAVDLFIELLGQVQKKRSKPYVCNDADTKSWEAWCNYYQSRGVKIGEDFIRRYIEYGLQSWFNDAMTETQKYNCRFNWIFGSKGIKRWNALDADTRNFCVTSHLKQRFTIKRKVKKSTRLSSILVKIRPVEEKFKREYLNTSRGLLWCKANTTLYNHKSSACAVCIYNRECKEILKMNTPSVYKLRGYKDEQ